MTATVLFLHGLEGSPTGTKARRLVDAGFQLVAPALPKDDFPAALAIARTAFETHRPAVVVGSSRGGALALALQPNNAAVVLMCPAWRRFAPDAHALPGTVILHAEADEIVPFADSLALINRSGLPAVALIRTGSDHRLGDEASLVLLVERVRAGCRLERPPQGRRPPTATVDGPRALDP